MNKLEQIYARMYSGWTSEDHALAARRSKDPEYINYHNKQAKVKSETPVQKEETMSTPLINATLRYLDEQALDEAKKSPWEVKKHEGDDEYSYALFKNGKPAMTGLGKREAKYHLERANAGHYDRKLDEEVEQLDETKMRVPKKVPHNEIHVKDVVGDGRYTDLKVHAVGENWKEHVKVGDVLDDDWYGDLETSGAKIKEID
jgi:hypothetical protein